MIWLVSAAFAQDAYRFAVIGDPQTDGDESSVNWDVLPVLVEDMNAKNPDVLLVAGDLVGGAYSVGSTVTQWEDFLLATADFDGTVYAVPGNHDVYGGSGTFAAWKDTFGFPTDDSPTGEEGVSYFVDHGNTRFVFVTSDQENGGTGLSSEALVWLDRVLSESSEFAHVYVVTHHPISFSTESSIGGTQGDFWQLMVAYGVEGTFMGHWHRYQPSQPGGGGPTWETIIGTGGGWTGFEPIREYQQQWGFLLVEVDGAYAEATFFGDADGDGRYDDALDSFVLESGGEPLRGLRAEYRFDTDASDGVPLGLGKGVHGELLGDAHVADGHLILDGDGDAVEAGAIGDYVLAVNGDLTVAGRFRVDALESGQWANTLICYGTNDYYSEDEETNYSWWLSVTSDGILRAFWEHGDGSNVVLDSTVASAMADGEFHRVALVRRGDVVEFWQDGEQLGDSVPFTEPPSGGGRGMVYIGADTRAYLGSESDLHGAVDDVCIWDEALSGEDIGLLETTACADLDDGPEDTDPPDTDEPDTDEPTGDSDPDDSEDQVDDTPRVELEPNCGCTSGAAPTGLAFLLLAAFVRRRSRAEA
ncbi:MAG: hypothetical protein GY913_15200 [Proteobacteria bacterium]|nr:hypothetical protein [Pseudomonadota bacterium]MCP4918256.1 hypothetical protein [Pseudomonadota bacterium]